KESAGFSSAGLKTHEKNQTRSRAREEEVLFEYLQLSPRIRKSGRRIQRSPSPPNRTLSTPPPGRPFTQSTRVLRPIRMAQNNPYVNFTGSSPLALNEKNPISMVITPGDHVKDIANLCAIHEINEMQVAIKLLASSFKGKALQWFRSLTS
ncbi:hypothetical protein KI387_035028, partial [Taxus chinensis]